jgi:HEAT repeat protein
VRRIFYPDAGDVLMFGFEWDELAVIVGGSFLAARLLWSLGRVLWCFALDAEFGFPQIHLVERFAGVAGLLLAVGILSIASGGVRGAGGGLGTSVLAYTVVGLLGMFLGSMLDLTVELLMYRVFIRLRALRVPRYREQLLHGDEAVRLQALSRLSWLGARARPARPELLSLLPERSAALRARAAHVLLDTIPDPPDDDPELVRAARPLLTDADLTVRIAGAAILAAYRQFPDELIPVLTDGLKTGGEDVIDRAIQALGRLGPAAEPALPLLRETLFKAIEPGQELMDSRESEVVSYVLEALKRIGAAAVPVFIELLERGDSLTKWNAARALGSMGEPAKAALPALRKLAIQRDTLVSPAAKKAIEELGGEIT